VKPIRIATRGSDLALAQSRALAARMEETLRVRTELVVVTTSGDRLQHVSLAKVGGKGLFVKEIEQALVDHAADVAVHSAKDLPVALAPGCVLAAFPERVDCRDALVSRVPGTPLAGLRRGARVGTGSARRGAQLRCHRPDLEIVPLRGNVPTRLRKLESEDLDAVVLACAGLERLGLGDRIDERISTDVLLPALAQGTLALETRDGDPLLGPLRALDDPAARASIGAERSFLARLEGDCNVPIAGLAEVAEDGSLHLRGLVADPDGRRLARGEARAPGSEATALGIEVGEQVLAAGGDGILRALREAAADGRTP